MAWKPIKSAPRDGTRIMVAGVGRDGFPYVGVGFRSERGWRVDEELLRDNEPEAPSYWMRFPMPPEVLDPHG